MTLACMSHVWRMTDVTPAEKLVLLYLSDAADDHGYCWPSINSIAAGACITERYCTEVIQTLVEKGRLAIVAGASERRTHYFRILGMPDPIVSSGSTSSRPRTPAHLRAWVFFRDEGKCAYCNGPATEIDHVKARSKGGADVFDNLVAACKTCNASKRDRDRDPIYSPIYAKLKVNSVQDEHSSSLNSVAPPIKEVEPKLEPKEKMTTTSSSSSGSSGSPDFGSVVLRALEKNYARLFRDVTPLVLETLKSWAAAHPNADPAVITDAFRTAEMNGVRKWTYIEKVLESRLAEAAPAQEFNASTLADKYRHQCGPLCKNGCIMQEAV